MMSIPYIPGDVIDEARDLLRRGERLDVLAGRLRINPESLQKLLDVGNCTEGKSMSENSRHPLTPDDVENIRQLRGFAYSWAEIAQALNRSEPEVRAAVQQPAVAVHVIATIVGAPMQTGGEAR